MLLGVKFTVMSLNFELLSDILNKYDWQELLYEHSVSIPSYPKAIKKRPCD